MEVVAQTGSGHEAVRLCYEEKPDVLVLDYGLPDLDGLETTRLIRAGASGFIVKTAPTAQLLDAVRKVSRNQLFVSMPIMEKMVSRVGQPATDRPESLLSNRELQVLIRLAQGMTTKEVAEALHLSTSTVDTYRRRILEKLDLRNNADMTRFAIRRNLIHLE